MLKTCLLAGTILGSLMLTNVPAEARSRQHHYQHHAHHYTHHHHHYASRSHHSRHYASRHIRGDMVMSVGGYGPRPHAWCGYFMRTMFGGGPEYNLARNWINRGSPAAAQVGAVVVWPHHVGLITGKASNGEWIIKSGNDGGRVRERPRSVAGAIAFRVNV